MPITRIEDPTVFVGLSYEEAKARIEGYGYSCRLIHQDGRSTYFKPDYDPLRVSISVMSGVVTKAAIGW
jgi:hypothetical protein